jgi:molybdate transport system substrate-binding protein
MAIEQTGGEPISGISSIAMRHVLGELVDAYWRESGQRVAVESVGSVDAARRVQAGDAFDFVVLAADVLEKLAGNGHVLRDSRVDLARSGVAIAVAAWAPRPDIGDESRVREAVLAARSVGYSTGPSGVYLARLFERWGIAATIAPRLVQAPAGVPVGMLLARGEVELGFQQLSELSHLPGIVVVGPLPPEIQLITTFSAAVCAASHRPEAARTLLAFLASPAADTAKRRHGMEPA